MVNDTAGNDSGVEALAGAGASAVRRSQPTSVNASSPAASSADFIVIFLGKEIATGPANSWTPRGVQGGGNCRGTGGGPELVLGSGGGAEDFPLPQARQVDWELGFRLPQPGQVHGCTDCMICSRLYCSTTSCNWTLQAPHRTYAPSVLVGKSGMK